ncbi:DNA-binding response regulator, OmpR family, contains REC and winged-helix (wHTH) domain [Quadrisphaera granulorum]|uniref:DNA-binding response OmpR family regulator n=1 Tax=Quadrisphaera granulorum TaxID=317664 RepID=A0A316ASU7_9ACTN|nr:response regulator transcription factor [Quadrisphaera granulorum]PWJ53167.1 DNA-binding response OmpR family regulator [Quadrisphaera granulorum]SZE97099.1 DNA-binding response regulator, OmpR family, contains REC and winged-helix (wHTH) domain [Quadrisphaera granulorum]
MAVLVVEDEAGITAFLRKGLESAGFTVLSESSGRAGALTALREDVELVILDLGLPDLPGEQVLTRIRAARPALPVIVLTAKDAVPDRVANLEAGADDYVVKPFSFTELLARVRARLRQPAQPSSVVLSAGGLTLDVRTRRVRVYEEGDDGAGHAREVALSSREFALLETLLRHPGQVLSQVQLLDRVWGYDFDGASNVVETCVRHVRRKVGAERIETVRGAGYRLVA